MARLNKSDLFPIETDRDLNRAVHMLEWCTPEDRENPETLEAYKILDKLIAEYDGHTIELPTNKPCDNLRILFSHCDAGSISFVAWACGIQPSRLADMYIGQIEIDKIDAINLSKFFGVSLDMFWQPCNN
jgi:hypothetical protein